MPELTGPQVIVKTGYKKGKQPLTYDKIRLMRRHPTISLARKLFYAGIIIGEWQFESKEDVAEDVIDYVRSQLEPVRDHLLQKASLGCFDYGWQPFEKVFDIVDGKMIIKKIKPLIQDNTDVEEEEKTGSFLGFKQGEVEIPLENALLFSWDGEGTDYHGESTLANAEWPYDSVWALDDAATRFDKKMAGAHWVVTFPDGVSNFNGDETPNHIVAQNVLEQLQSSGMIAICSGSDLAKDLEDEQSGWSIKLITASGATFPFADRFAYLDKLMVRACGFPERAILEGQFGTKAESETQGDFAIVLIEDRHKQLVKVINWHLVNQLLRMEYGPEYENKVWIKPSPLGDASRAILKAVYDKLLSSPDAMVVERESLDIQAIAESLGIPRIELSDDLPDFTQPVDEGAPGGNPDGTQPPAPPAPATAALNGGQITSLINLATLVKTQALDAPAAFVLAKIAFPDVDDSLLDSLFKGITVIKPVTTDPAPKPSGASTDVVN